MRKTACAAIGILLLLPMCCRAEEPGFGNRLPYWSPPVHKKLPKKWMWTELYQVNPDYSLGDATFLPSSRWVVFPIVQHFWMGEDRLNYVGQLGVDVQTGSTRFLALPQETAGLEFRFPSWKSSQLSPTTAGVVIACGPAAGEQDKPKMKPLQLLWSWNPKSGELHPVGNAVPVDSLLYSLAATPYSVSWLDREAEAWSGKTMLLNRQSGKFLGYLPVATRINYPPGKEFQVDPIHGGRFRKPMFDVDQFHPTANPHRILRRRFNFASKSRKRHQSIDCINLENNNAVVWTLDIDSIDKAGGGKLPPFVQFCDGMMRPCRHVVLRSLPGDFDRPQEIWILDTEDGKVTKKLQLPKEASPAFEPDVSANGRYVMLETGRYLESDGDKEPKRRLYVLDTQSGRAVLHRLFASGTPLSYPSAVLNDGTVVLTNSFGVALWKPPYKGDPEWVYEMKADKMPKDLSQ